jgi:ribosomal protein L34E
MRKFAPVILLAGASAMLAACGAGGGVFNRDRPDEFAVQRQAPLVVPPDFTLTPPAPGAPRPSEGTASEQALEPLFGGPAPRSRVEAEMPPAGRGAGGFQHLHLRQAALFPRLAPELRQWTQRWIEGAVRRFRHPARMLEETEQQGRQHRRATGRQRAQACQLAVGPIIRRHPIQLFRDLEGRRRRPARPFGIVRVADDREARAHQLALKAPGPELGGKGARCRRQEHDRAPHGLQELCAQAHESH